MVKKKNKLKFLSESILLEETGLPKMNVVITVCVSLFIVAFVAWANLVVLEEDMTIGGQVTVTTLGHYEMLGLVPAKDIVDLSVEDPVYVSIPGVTGREKMTGMITAINTSPQYDTSGNVFYKATIVLESNDSDQTLFEGMEGSISVVTGNKTLLQYLLGNLYDSGKDAFNIK